MLARGEAPAARVGRLSDLAKNKRQCTMIETVSPQFLSRQTSLTNFFPHSAIPIVLILIPTNREAFNR